MYRWLGRDSLVLKNQHVMKLIAYCYTTVGHAGAIIAAGRGTAEHKVVRQELEHVLWVGCLSALCV